MIQCQFYKLFRSSKWDVEKSRKQLLYNSLNTRALFLKEKKIMKSNVKLEQNKLRKKSEWKISHPLASMWTNQLNALIRLSCYIIVIHQHEIQPIPTLAVRTIGSKRTEWCEQQKQQKKQPQLQQQQPTTKKHRKFQCTYTVCAIAVTVVRLSFSTKTFTCTHRDGQTQSNGRQWWLYKRCSSLFLFFSFSLSFDV